MRDLVHRAATRRFPQSLPCVLLFILFAALSSASCGGEANVREQRTALEQQRRQLLTQFAAAQNRVRQTQAQALGDSSVVPLQERFYERLHDRMIEIEPRAEAWLARARELGPELDVLSRPQIIEPGDEPVSREEQRAVVERFKALEDSLRPVQNRAMADPDVAAAFSALQDSLHAVMVEINPAAAAALDQMRRTSAAVDSINAEIRRLGEP